MLCLEGPYICNDIGILLFNLVLLETVATNVVSHGRPNHEIFKCTGINKLSLFTIQWEHAMNIVMDAVEKLLMILKFIEQVKLGFSFIAVNLNSEKKKTAQYVKKWPHAFDYKKLNFHAIFKIQYFIIEFLSIYLETKIVATCHKKVYLKDFEVKTTPITKQGNRTIIIIIKKNELLMPIRYSEQLIVLPSPLPIPRVRSSSICVFATSASLGTTSCKKSH